MKTVVLGKKIENVYDVDYKWKETKDTNGDVKTVYTDKPEIKKTSNVIGWGEICSFKGEPRYNEKRNGYYVFPTRLYDEMNISENETVSIEEKIFRADLNELHLYTNKVLEEDDINEQESKYILEEQIRAFNKMMIESNDKLKSYCDLHKLSYKKTDCIELFKLVFPDDKYEIVDGVMKVKKSKSYTVCDTYCYNTIQANTEAVSVDGTLLSKVSALESSVDALTCIN